MGQQQLLLVILVTIIVGIATVVAINTFSSASEGANVDAVTNDVAQIASSAQGYYMQPTMMGGGGNSFTGMTFDDITFASDSTNAAATTAYNSNGVYQITVAGDGSTFDVDATPATAGGLVEATVGQDGVQGSINYNPDGTEIN